MDDGANHVNPLIDPTYGQRSALPDFYDGDESVSEALGYLRSVRSEASAIPHLLVAEEKPNVDDEKWSHLGYYEDGTYTGTAPYEELQPSMSATQQAYYDGLRLHFAATRSKLAQSPPLLTISPVNSSAVLNPSSSHAQYLHGFLYKSPIPRELAKASQEAVMTGLRRYAAIMNKRNFQQGEEENSHLGAWGWALLAKCRELGQLDSEDVSTIREVAKAAIRLTNKIRISPVPSMECPEDGEVQDESKIEEEASISQNDPIGAGDSSAVATLDILITIIGEEFGQRDLLEGRQVW
ncbi:MAG: hypothetical protein GOMPHAMPRED_001122 [Gomphillus americanus]|uniref:Uncharacterized protein n=1 Tax=Gomphillus americanus TaxID=1940652 RepID=A0A8H3F9U1_9LECA|nr:MAG: hypothetical protein GOMPHAMPRED_001122 [Gomphillus americanus]